MAESRPCTLMAIMRSRFPGVRAEDGAQEHQAGIVDQDVESPELPGSLLDGRLGLGAVGDVRLDGQRGAACVLDVGGEGLQAVAAAGHERDAGAVLGESAGGGGADTAAGAGDERGGARPVSVSWVLSVFSGCTALGQAAGRPHVVHLWERQRAAVQLLAERARP